MICTLILVVIGGNLNESTITQVFQRLEINKQLAMYSEFRHSGRDELLGETGLNIMYVLGLSLDLIRS